MKKIFIIKCEVEENYKKKPYVEAYVEATKNLGHEVREVNIYDYETDFLKSTQNGIDFQTPEELKTIQENILWANQLVFVYPIWWLTIPAKLKSFIELVFAEGVVSKMDKMGPKPLMKDKTAVIIQSYSMPYFCLKYIYGDVTMKWWKIILTGWCGPKIIKRFDYDMIDNISEKRHKNLIKKIQKFVNRI